MNTVSPIDPILIAQVMGDGEALSAIQRRQDERNARLLVMGEQARRANFMSKFDLGVSDNGHQG